MVVARKCPFLRPVLISVSSKATVHRCGWPMTCLVVAGRLGFSSAREPYHYDRSTRGELQRRGGEPRFCLGNDARYCISVPSRGSKSYIQSVLGVGQSERGRSHPSPRAGRVRGILHSAFTNGWLPLVAFWHEEALVPRLGSHNAEHPAGPGWNLSPPGDQSGTIASSRKLREVEYAPVHRQIQIGFNPCWQGRRVSHPTQMEC